MIYYLTQDKNPDNETLPPECPWLSFFYDGVSDLPEGAIVMSKDEYDLFYKTWENQILLAKDKITMRKRAAVMDALIGEFGSENKERVRLGIWTVAQLIELTQDPTFKMILDDIYGLSFELAITKIQGFNNVLITPEIKAGMIDRITQNLFL